VFTVKGEYVHHAAMPTPQDKAHLSRSVANLMAEHRRTAEFDTDKGGMSAVDAWLRGMLGEASETG